MRTHSSVGNVIARTVLVVSVLGAFGAGCGGDKGTDNDNGNVDYSPNVDDDVATSIAASLAADNGGAADQIVDIVSLASMIGLRFTNLVANEASPTYNLDTRTWQWSLVREYSSAQGLYFARVERTYQWRFLNKNDEPQVTYIFANDTAYSIELTIVSGAGRHRMPYLSQTLTSLSGQLVATGTNTDEITVNGSWTRSALDTIRTRYAVRTLVHASTLTITDMVCEHDSSAQPWQSISGTITGAYSADIHFISGDAYVEDTVSREVAIALDTGVTAITLNDSTWTYYLRRGEIKLPEEPE